MEWIAIKDRLPDDSHGRILCWIEYQSDLGKSSYFWNCSFSPKHGFMDNMQEIYGVTHWMPIEPPKSNS